ncbi:hypothetical protein GCM10029963_57430 [Micromonospora andamanensis]|uniref:hypothetical protein n=1 Tax=Micromonospora andamanensis TaxID=1287068 RepID=UPI00195211E1|nr:hypothetical protein [Micromonospora andamanensis]GIJ37855.1 hypothetical protein Vwe01_11800 [Micromonospora andamanensis]
MALLDVVVTAAGGALSATVGVLVGGMLTRRAQDQHWLRDRQLVAYQDLLREYATFSMILRRAHLGRSGWDYDWGAWSAALMAASLVAPIAVATEIDKFGQAVRRFLDATAEVDTTTAPLSQEQFEQAMVAPARAQLALVNAMRRSVGRHQRPLPVWLGGASGPPDPPADS